MRLASLTLTAALPAVTLWAGGDPAFEASLRQIREGMARYEEAESTSIDLPAPSMALGQATGAYQCWRLLLTGEHGKRVLDLMQRIKAQRDALVDLKAKLVKDIELYGTLSKPDPALQQRILSESAGLEPLLASYKTLVEAGESGELLRRAEKGFFRDRSAIIPRMNNDDYTMVYDDSAPGCKAGGQGG